MNTKNAKLQGLKIDLSKERPMKCYCGSNLFYKSNNLYYISPILCGDPQGATATIFMYECKLCGQMYPKALAKSEIDKLYNALDPIRKSKIDAVRANLKANQAEAAGILAGKGPKAKRHDRH